MHLPHAFRNAGRISAALFLLVMSFAAIGQAHAQSGPVLPNTTGEQKTAVILVNFTDSTTQPKTVAEVQTLVFGQVSDFYWEASYQRTFLSGDTFGWFTLPVSTAGCSWDAIVTEGNRAAVVAGADLSAYTHFIYLYPNASGCVSGGGGTVGPNGQKRVFVNGATGFTVQMIAHEMGHGFGLLHSDALDCDTSPLGNTCVQRGYADAADTMGSEGHFNAFQKERLGWLDVAGAPPITTVASSGRYSIEPYETTGTGAKALKILKSTDAVSGQKTWYYLEYRQPVGFDSLLAGRGNLTTGVLVRTGTIASNGIATSLQLDMTPGSSDWIGIDFQDGALGVGRSFNDPSNGMTISLAAADANGATVDVSFGGASPPPTCTRAAPTLSVSGPTGSAAAGSTVNYTLSLGNNDGSTCTATTFNLARSVPSGWTGTLAASSLNLSPGATASTTLSVTSAGNAGAGGYGIGIGSSSGAASVHTASTSITYSVAEPSSGTLSESVGTDKTSYLRGQTVTMSALVRSNGVAISGASVRFNLTLSNGSVTVLNATSGSDGYARSTYKLGKGKGAIGNYTLRADATFGGSTATASSSFSVR